MKICGLIEFLVCALLSVTAKSPLLVKGPLPEQANPDEPPPLQANLETK
jgi:hypothetical protein